MLNRRAKNTARIILSILLCLMSLFMLSGCEDVQIFEDPSLKGKLVKVKDKDLEPDIYYVKSGTDFYATCVLKGDSNVLYAENYVDTTIPTCYKGELIVQSAKDDSFKKAELTRYRDLGYGPGVYSATYDKENNICTFKKGGIQKEATMYKAVEQMESDSIRVLTVQGEDLSNKHISPNSGVIYNFNKNDQVDLTLYAGTYYHDVHVSADTELFERMETYDYGEEYITDTQNGYRSFRMPEDLQSGYYMINNKGMFRYVNYAHGEGDPDSTNYNVPGSGEQMSEEGAMRQYSINLDNDMANLRIIGVYDDTGMENEDTVKGVTIAPDGTEYAMTVNKEENTIKVDLTEAMTGRWQVNIFPQNLAIVDISAENITPRQELTEEAFTLATTEQRNNIAIILDYSNVNGRDQKEDVTVTGSVIAPDGQTYIMKKQKSDFEKTGRSGYLEADITFAPEGEYKVVVNHYPDETTVSGPNIFDNTEGSQDIVVIEE